MAPRNPEYEAALAAEHDSSLKIMLEDTYFDTAEIAQNIADNAAQRGVLSWKMFELTKRAVKRFGRKTTETASEDEQHELDKASNILFDAVDTVKRYIDPDNSMGDVPIEMEHDGTTYIIESYEDEHYIEQYESSAEDFGSNAQLIRTLHLKEAPVRRGFMSTVPAGEEEEIEDIPPQEVLRVASGLLESLDS